MVFARMDNEKCIFIKQKQAQDPSVGYLGAAGSGMRSRCISCGHILAQILALSAAFIHGYQPMAEWREKCEQKNRAGGLSASCVLRSLCSRVCDPKRFDSHWKDKQG